MTRPYGVGAYNYYLRNWTKIKSNGKPCMLIPTSVFHLNPEKGFLTGRPQSLVHLNIGHQPTTIQMSLGFYILLIVIVIVESGFQQPECIDAIRTLRCVLPANCPSRLVRNNKKCPKGRTCCRLDKPNPYLPLRVNVDRNIDSLLWGRISTNGESTPTTTEKSFYDQDYLYEDRIIFPTDSDYKKRQPKWLPQKNNWSARTKPLEVDNDVKDNVKLVRKSIKYCREIKKLTVDVGYVSPPLKELTPLSYEMENCEPGLSPLVVGGTNATISQYPHMVALGYNNSGDIDYLCGGSLISDQFVLTAAHCIRTKWGVPEVVYMGATELYMERAKMFLVEKMHIHPQYRAPAIYNDIALVELKRKVQLTPKLRPACLPTEETPAQYPGQIAVATGWGRIGFGREASKTLRQVALKVIDNEKCGSYYTADVMTPTLQNGIVPNMLCAGGNTDSSQDTCQGDSGGPLQSIMAGSTCLQEIVGITSFGKECGIGIPGVYTRVARYLAWIENIVWPD